MVDAILFFFVTIAVARNDAHGYIGQLASRIFFLVRWCAPPPACLGGHHDQCTASITIRTTRAPSGGDVDLRLRNRRSTSPRMPPPSSSPTLGASSGTLPGGFIRAGTGPRADLSQPLGHGVHLRFGPQATAANDARALDDHPNGHAEATENGRGRTPDRTRASRKPIIPGCAS